MAASVRMCLSTHDHLSWNLWVGGGVDQTERGLTSSLTPLCSLAALNTVVIETLAASIMAPRLAHYTQRRNCQHYTSLHYLPKTRIGAETRGGRVAGWQGGRAGAVFLPVSVPGAKLSFPRKRWNESPCGQWWTTPVWSHWCGCSCCTVELSRAAL